MNNWEENENLRCDFIEITGLKLWSEQGDQDAGFTEEYVFWLEERIIWKNVFEETPPKNVELLAKSPEGVIHLCSWRETHSIFTVQNKNESSFNWQWKHI